ncbi:hypothetical protein D9Q98_006138 [Chlorella vulgaris]|uniref:glutamate formimidoyltransferase n=1 Tax=Chlorella vulgaris TaxID=3077 RepID=A0A9D4Z196_CHLVU|nr:hypothetical protein D9Q98_006138 [Chlorella vulgaris]
MRSFTSPAATSTLYGCAVYVSEARNGSVLRQLEGVARRAPGTCLANLFVDEPYNRTNFTLVGRSVPQLATAATTLARAAMQLLSLQQHSATHPRLGTVDHISCHPLQVGPPPPAAAAAAATPASACLREGLQLQEEEGAAALALAIARDLGGGPQAVPVFTYGWAHPQQRRLDALRRQLGYFQGSTIGSWAGALPLASAPETETGTGPLRHDHPQLSPCYGPGVAPARSGISCVGAGPWIVNFNVLLLTDDMLAARAVARNVSERGGGLRCVQAMALRHSNGIEVACNLLDTAVTESAAVLACVEQLAAQRGLTVGGGYFTNLAPKDLVATALSHGL